MRLLLLLPLVISQANAFSVASCIRYWEVKGKMSPEYAAKVCYELKRLDELTKDKKNDANQTRDTSHVHAIR